MSKFEIVNKLSRKFGKTGLKIKKHSPEILIGIGVVGTVATTIVACKATTKLSSVLEKSKQDLETYHTYIDEHGYSDEYTEEDAKKDLVIMYTQAGVAVAKLYAPAVALGVLSITSILAGNHILHKRNVAIAAAYAAVEQSFKDYRNRVVDRFGAEMDRELKYNIVSKEIEEVVANEDGSETVVKKTVNVIDPNTICDTSRIWCEGNPGWTKNPEFNLMYLKNQQRYANDKLKIEGYLFLNDVYDMLGYPKTAAGQQIGWIYDEKNPIGDNFVDFGLYDIHSPVKNDFINGYERSVLLEFNHDGNILSYM